jgi:GTPase
MDVPEIIVLNKADLAAPEVIARLRSRELHTIVVSARTGEGIEELEALIADQLPRPGVLVEVVVPYDRGDLVSRVHLHGDIDSEEHIEQGTLIRARVDAALAAELASAAVAAGL